MTTKTIEQLIEDVKKFDKRQIMEAFYWMILGDGCIEQKERGNYNISVSHKEASYDYLLWKGAIVNAVTNCSIKEQTIYGGFSEDHKLYRLRSSAHPWFTKVWNRIYGQLGRKCLDPMALSLLSPLGLAILYQDDGSIHYSKQAGTNVLLHKLCFSRFELEALAKTIVDKFGLIFRINACNGKGFGFRLRLRAKDVDRFIELISPFVVPSMVYKVTRGGNL